MTLTRGDQFRFSRGDRSSLDDTSAPHWPGLLRGVLPIGRRESLRLCPASFIDRAALRRVAAVGILPRIGFRVAFCSAATEFLGCGGASPTPQVQCYVFKLKLTQKALKIFQLPGQPSPIPSLVCRHRELTRKKLPLTEAATDRSPCGQTPLHKRLRL